MSASRFKRPRGWKMARPANPEPPRATRQLRRQFLRIKSWADWKCYADRAPRDDSGVMSRKVRRSIAREIATKAGKKLEGT
jgi:hypothetical protein